MFCYTCNNNTRQNTWLDLVWKYIYLNEKKNYFFISSSWEEQWHKGAPSFFWDFEILSIENYAHEILSIQFCFCNYVLHHHCCCKEVQVLLQQDVSPFSSYFTSGKHSSLLVFLFSLLHLQSIHAKKEHTRLNPHMATWSNKPST